MSFGCVSQRILREMLMQVEHAAVESSEHNMIDKSYSQPSLTRRMMGDQELRWVTPGDLSRSMKQQLTEVVGS